MYYLCAYGWGLVCSLVIVLSSFSCCFYFWPEKSWIPSCNWRHFCHILNFCLCPYVLNNSVIVHIYKFLCTSIAKNTEYLDSWLHWWHYCPNLNFFSLPICTNPVIVHMSQFLCTLMTIYKHKRKAATFSGINTDNYHLSNCSG